MGIRGWSSIFLLSLAFGLLMPSAAQDLPQQPLHYVQWSPFPEIITAANREQLLFFSPQLTLLHTWQVAIEAGRKGINYYAWSRDGSRIAFMMDDLDSSSGVSLEIWDTQSAQRIAEIPNTYPEFLEWSPDGKYLVFNVRISHLQNEIWFIHGQDGSIAYQWEMFANLLIWSPTGQQLALRDNGLELWNVTTFPPQLTAQLPNVYDAAYDQLGTHIALSPLDDRGKIYIYDLPTLQAQQTIITPNGIDRLSWGSAPLTSAVGTLVQVWNSDTGEILLTFNRKRLVTEFFYVPSWNPSGRMFVVNDATAGITVRDGQTGEILAALPPDASLITATPAPIPMPTPTTR